MPENTTPKTATIECPRCGGAGRRPFAWQPDAGVCYRCKGRCTVEVHVAKHQAALHMLRAKFVRLRDELRQAPKGADTELLRESLQRCVASGQRVRADLEDAGVEVA